MTYLAECIEYLVEVHKDLALGDLCNVIQALGREVPHAVLWVCETDKQGVDELVRVVRYVHSEGDSGASKTYKAAVASLQRVGGIAEHVHQLVDNLRYSPLIALLLAFTYQSGKLDGLRCFIRVKTNIRFTSLVRERPPSASRTSCPPTAWRCRYLQLSSSKDIQ